MTRNGKVLLGVLKKMEIRITQDISGTGPYQWKLYDGPDGVDWFDGECESLGECFEKIVSSRTVNALSYS